MKVFFVGYKNPHFQAVTDYIELALGGMGHDVRFFDYRSFLIPGRLRERVRALEDWDRARLNRRIRDLVADWRPELFLVNGGYTMEPETVKAARRAGAVTANWFSDYPYLFDIYLKLAPAFDFFFTSGSEALARHRRAGNKHGHFLPFGCLRDHHRPVKLTREEAASWGSDLAFVGTAYPERVEIFQKIVGRFPGVNLALWGPGWDRLPASSPIRAFVRGGPLRMPEWLKVVAATKIAFNHMGTGGFPMDPAKGKMCNSRVFELLGCGACQLVDAKDDVKALFTQRVELAYYEDDAEMFSLIDYYLHSPDERRALGGRAREAALAKHTYRHRLAELIRICGGASA